MKKTHIRAAAALAAVVLLFSAVPRVEAISARSAILIDADSGRVIYEKSPREKSLIASTTKIMTALVVCEQCNVLDRVQIMPEAVGIEGSSMYLQEGEVLTVQELLYGLMLHSGNDAAVALAIYCGGTVEGFVSLMNDEARRLGLENTHFENPNGLDNENHYSTAEDLAKLTAYAMENEIFAKTVSTKTVQVGQRHLTNHNKLLWRYEGADGVKTGYTKAAGRILVSSARKDGRRLVAVTIHAPDDWNDHTALLNMGFKEYETKTIVKKGDCIGNVVVISGDAQTTQILSEEDFQYPLAESENVRYLLSGPGFIYAPVRAGDDAGFVHILVEGKPVGKIRVSYGNTVEQSRKPGKSSLLHGIFGGGQ